MELQRQRMQSLFLPASSFFASTFRGRNSIPWSAAAQTQPEKDTWTSSSGAIPSPASREDESRRWQSAHSSDGQRDLGWTQSRRLFTELRKKAGVSGTVHSTLSPITKAWCLQHKKQKWRKTSNSGGKVPVTRGVQGVPHSGTSLHQGTKEPPQGPKSCTALNVCQPLSKYSRYLPWNMFARGKSAHGDAQGWLGSTYPFSALKQQDSELKLLLKA